MTLETLDVSILGPAFVAGLVVLATHVPLGREVLSRGIIFIDLAVAQIAALGVVVAQLLGWQDHIVATQTAATLAALAGAALLHRSERRWPDIQEALIGVAFVLAATGGILLLAGDPHGGERLKELLVGQILWVGWNHTAIAALLSTALLMVWFSKRLGRQPLCFYLVFALAVTISVQLVGVYLVFASLIIPALAIRKLPAQKALIAGWSIGAAGYGLGLTASAVWDLPAGPAIVWCLALAAAIGGIPLAYRKTS